MFRDSGGIWDRFDPLDLATPKAFERDPVVVHEFYNLRRERVVSASPNAGHEALFALETRVRDNGGDLFPFTQNVDDLHDRVSSVALTHMHGELLKVRCLHCEAVSSWRTDLSVVTACPICGQAGGMRPNVVWFGEMPKYLDVIEAAVRASDLFVAIGTSGAVYPAAGYISLARKLDIRTCELNLQPSDNADVFDEARYGPVTQIVPDFVDERPIRSGS